MSGKILRFREENRRPLLLIRKPACCRSEPPSTDILKPQNLSKMCLFFILFSRIIINVIILKQLVASGERGYRNILDPAFMTFAGPPAVTFTHMMKKRSLSAPATFPLYVCKNSKFKTPQKVGSTKMHVKNSD